MVSHAEALKVRYVPAAYIKYILYVLAVYYICSNHVLRKGKSMEVIEPVARKLVS